MAKPILAKTIRIQNNNSQKKDWEEGVATPKNTEEALRKSELHYRNLFNSMTDGFSVGEIVCDKSGNACDYRFVEVNPAFERFIGFKSGEIVGKLRSQIPVILNRSSFAAYVKTAFTGEPQQFENYNKTLKKYYSVQVYRPAPMRFASIFTDITEKKKASEALRESEARALDRSQELEKVLDAVPAAVWIAHDPKALYVTGNDLSYKWLRIARGANASKSAPAGQRPETFRIFKNGKEIKPEEMPVQLSAKGEEIRDYEFTFVYPDGAERHVLGNATPLLDEAGRARGSVSSFIDITARKQSEESLRQTKEYLESLFDYANAPIIVWDSGFKITRFNGAFERLTKYSASEVIGKELAILFPEDSRQDSLDKINQTLAGEQWEVVEIPIRRKDGQVRIALWNSANIYDKSGKVLIATIAQGQDITERKIAETRLNKLNRTLKALSNANLALIKAKTEESYLKDICKIIIEDCGHKMTWIGFKNDDESKSVSPVACSGFEDGYLETLNITWDDTERGRGPTGTAIRQGKPCSCANMLIDPAFKPWRKEALKRGYASSLSLPLSLGNSVLGAITVYSPEPKAFLDQEIELLKKLADNVASGISSLRLEKLKKEAEDASRKNRERLGLALASSRMATFDWDIINDKRIWSDGVHKLLGTDPKNFSGTAEEFFRIMHPDDRNSVRTALDKAIKTGIYETEYRAIWPDGSVHYIAARGKVHRGDSGKPVLMTGVCWDITDRKLAEEAFKTSELKYRRLFESAKDGILILDFETGIIMDVNPFLVGMLGYSYEDILKKHLWDIGIFKDIVSSKEAFLELQKKEFIRYENLPLETKAGKKMFVEFVSNVYFVDGKKVIQCNVRDITDRKLAEEELRKTNQRLAIISYSANRLLTSEDPRLVVEDLCQRVMEFLDCQVFFNYLVDEKTNRLHLNAWSGIPPQTAKPIEWLSLGEAVCGCVARDGIQIICDHIQESPDPRTQLIKSFGIKAYACHPLLDLDRVIGTLSFGASTRDTFSKEDLSLMRAVTDQVAIAMNRIRTEEALRESEEKFRRIADTMPNLVWSAKPDGNVEYVNLTFRDYTGITKTSGMIWNVIPLNTNDRRAMEMARRRAAKFKRPYQLEQQIRRSDGNWRWHLTRCVPIINNDMIARWYGTATDIDDIKLAAEKLRETDEEKSKFISTMSHELRNPLTPIVTGIELVKSYLDLEAPGKPDSASDSIIRESVAIIDQQAKHMARLLDDMLDISRISRGKIQLKKQPVSLRDNLERAIEVVTPLIKTQNHKLSAALPDHSLRILADPVRLQQIFVNLLNNAIKYTPPNGQIWIKTELVGGFVQITVRDTGLGIDADKIKSIFMSYGNSRGITPFVSTQGELGIGLKLTKDLVSLHGGTITASSAGKDKGCEFTVRLRALPPGEDFAAGLESLDDDAKKAAGGMRALVVDDNANAADMTARALNFFGHDAKTCYDARAALDLAATYQPHIMFIDIEMPGMNGYELAKELRKMENQSLGPVKLVAITGYGQKEDKERALSAGFDLHLSKPVEMQSLRKAIDDLVPNINGTLFN